MLGQKKKKSNVLFTKKVLHQYSHFDHYTKTIVTVKWPANGTHDPFRHSLFLKGGNIIDI